MRFSVLSFASVFFVACCSEAATLLEFCESQAAAIEEYFADFQTECTCEEQTVSALLSCMDGCQACFERGNGTSTTAVCAYRDVEATIVSSTETTTGFRITESCHISGRETPDQRKMCTEPSLENSGSFVDVLLESEQAAGHGGTAQWTIKCPDDDSNSGHSIDLAFAFILASMVGSIGANLI